MDQKDKNLIREHVIAGSVGSSIAGVTDGAGIDFEVEGLKISWCTWGFAENV